MNQPNILLITTDQQRWDFLLDPIVPALELPHIAQLRRAGTTLANNFSNCPICMPTRMTWAHGLYASQVASGLLSNNCDWPRNLPSMPQALQRGGYHTALVGKLHSLAGLHPRSLLEEEAVTRTRGFDEAFEVSGKALAFWYECRWTQHLRERGLLDRYREDLKKSIWLFDGEEKGEPTFLDLEDTMDGFIGRHARAWLQDYDGAKPFFLHASFCGPHGPYDPHPQYLQRFAPDQMPPPAGVDDPAAIARWQKLRAASCGLIAQLDDEIGALLEMLEARGLSQSTLVLLTTDHGDMLGMQGLETKGFAHDMSTRTPVIARWPGQVPADETHAALAEAVDLPCTILDAAGLGETIEDALPGTPGRSYWPVLRGEREEHREWVFSEYGWGRQWRMCRESDWKYVYVSDGDDQLFDLERDPLELNNVINDPQHAQRVSRMRVQLIESMTHCAAADSLSSPGPTEKS